MLAHGKAVLGYAVLGPVALLLVAEAVRVSAVLPGGHQVKTVTQSRWHRINLQVNTGMQAVSSDRGSRGCPYVSNPAGRVLLYEQRQQQQQRCHGAVMVKLNAFYAGCTATQLQLAVWYAGAAVL